VFVDLSEQSSSDLTIWKDFLRSTTSHVQQQSFLAGFPIAENNPDKKVKIIKMKTASFTLRPSQFS